MLQNYVRIAEPTLFRIANRTTLGLEYPTAMITFAAGKNNRMLYQNVHGSVTVGETCDQLVYTDFPDAMHIILRKLIGLKIYTFASAFPQKITYGAADNVISMADTTQVYDLTDKSADITKTDLYGLRAIPYSELIESQDK